MTAKLFVDIQCAFRFPPKLVERLDKAVAHFQAKQPGVKFSRSDVVRMLLSQALNHMGIGE